jgi:hypothetical protein
LLVRIWWNEGRVGRDACGKLRSLTVSIRRPAAATVTPGVLNSVLNFLTLGKSGNQKLRQITY